MEEIRIIKETLRYVQYFQNLPMVVYLDDKVVTQAEELGITSDIRKLHGIGIKLLLVHNVSDLEIRKWFSLKGILQKIEKSIKLENIKEILKAGKIPIICCSKIADENVSQEEIAVNLAISIQAIKLIFLTHLDGVFNEEKKLIHQMTVKEAQKLLTKPGLVTGSMRKKVEAGIMACKKGIPRVHILSGLREGALLKEIFSCEGIGTMIYTRTPYQVIRPAKLIEIAQIMEILREAGFSLPIIFDEIAEKVKDFLVFTVDEQIHGCVLIIDHPPYSAIELAYLATSSTYRNTNVLQRLLVEAIKNAEKKKRKYIFLDKEKNPIQLGIYPWFLKLGFKKKEFLKTPTGKTLARIKGIWVKELKGSS